jgi:hypothetical protein
MTSGFFFNEEGWSRQWRRRKQKTASGYRPIFFFFGLPDNLLRFGMTLDASPASYRRRSGVRNRGLSIGRIPAQLVKTTMFLLWGRNS